MAIDLNLFRSKVVGPAPKGPLGAAKSRAAGFIAGRSFGLSKNKKSKAGASAGIGHAGRASAGGPRPLTTISKAPRGPGVVAGQHNPSVRLPNRQRFGSNTAAPKTGILGRFFKRFRKG